MRFTSFLILFLMALEGKASVLYRGSDLKPVSLEEALSEVKPGSVILLGESHGNSVHPQQHLAALEALRAKGFKLSVGLEFFSYPDQVAVTDFHQGRLSEAAFLEKIKWGSPSFDFYRAQALFPQVDRGEMLLALNAPRSLTSLVARGGLQSLSEVERALLPPEFTLGRDSYRSRFLALMPHLPSPEAGENYFAAQSVWDDTMAWRVSEFVKAHPDQILVVIVGEFHVQYGGGLPDRLRARGLTSVIPFSQILTEGRTSDEIQEELRASPVEGPRASWIWLDEAIGNTQP